MSSWWSLIQLFSSSEIIIYFYIMLCLLICRRVFVILHLCIGHLPCDRHCSRGWGLRGKRWSSQLISSKKCYGAHRSGTQCRPGQEGLGCRSCWRLLPKVSGVLAECPCLKDLKTLTRGRRWWERSTVPPHCPPSNTQSVQQPKMSFHISKCRTPSPTPSGGLVSLLRWEPLLKNIYGGMS